MHTKKCFLFIWCLVQLFQNAQSVHFYCLAKPREVRVKTPPILFASSRKKEVTCSVVSYFASSRSNLHFNGLIGSPLHRQWELFVVGCNYWTLIIVLTLNGENASVLLLFSQLSAFGQHISHFTLRSLRTNWTLRQTKGAIFVGVYNERIQESSARGFIHLHVLCRHRWLR